MDNIGKDLDVSGAAKALYVSVLTEENLLKYPELLYCSMKTDTYYIIHQLLGHMPRLASIGIYFTPVNEETVESQLWHIDSDQRFRQVKMFINLSPNLVEDSGPLQSLWNRES